MSTSIHIRFLTGRAHLHPWHAAPNEGRVEWPPSPWRLLRTLVAVAGRGLTTLPDTDTKSFSDDWFVMTASKKGKQITPDPFWSQHKDKLPLTKLSVLLHMLSGPPIVWLPRSGIGHTRHFFPTKSGCVTGSAVFDAFAAIDPQQSLVFEWPELNLGESVMEATEMLLSRLMYFGRSESWCEVALRTKPFQSGNSHCASVAIEATAAFETHFADRHLREHRDYSIEKRLGWNPEPNSLQFLRDKFKALLAGEAELLLRSLLQLSRDSMKHGDCPLGTRWFRYAVPKEIFCLPTRWKPRTRPDSMEDLRPQKKFQAVRYKLDTPTVHRAVLPPITATLAVAQRCRAAVLSIFGSQNNGRCSPQLCGKRFVEDENRYRLFAEAEEGPVIKFGDENGGHGAHANWWPVDEDGDGFLDHLIVLCHEGFSAKDMVALRGLHCVKQYGNHKDLLLTPVFEGRWEDCAVISYRLAGTALTFASATPYFCPVHLTRHSGKRRSVKEQVNQALLKNGMPGANQIDEIVFDYDPPSLENRQDGDPRQCLIAHLRNEWKTVSAQVVARRGEVIAAKLVAPLPVKTHIDNSRYRGALVRNPDDPCPLGMTRGMFVAGSRRFVPALAFHRVRATHDVAKGPGLMLRLTFDSPENARPFSIGQFCHFGLGLFVPVIDSGEVRVDQTSPEKPVQTNLEL